jgi:hypothetical protein
LRGGGQMMKSACAVAGAGERAADCSRCPGPGSWAIIMRSACAESWATSTGCGPALDGENCSAESGEGRAAAGVLRSPAAGGGGGDGRMASGGGAGARSGRAEGSCESCRGRVSSGSWPEAAVGVGGASPKGYLPRARGGS